MDGREACVEVVEGVFGHVNIDSRDVLSCDGGHEDGGAKEELQFDRIGVTVIRIREP